MRHAVQGGAQDQGENDGGGQHAGGVPAAEKPAEFLPHGGDKRQGGEKGHGEGGGNNRETRKWFVKFSSTLFFSYLKTI